MRRFLRMILIGLAGLAALVALWPPAQTYGQADGPQLTPTPVRIYLPMMRGGAGVPVTGAATFALGPGGSDVVPHQLVRTGADRLYAFTAVQSSPTVRVYYTPTGGFPENAAAFTAGPAFNETNGVPLSLDAAFDGSSLVYVVVNTTSGYVKLYPFDLATNTYKAVKQLATNGGTRNANDLYVGTSGVSAMVDLSGVLHVAYWRSDNRIVHAAYTYSASTGVLTTVSAATLVDTAGSANHPSLAVSPADNSVTVAWMSEASSQYRILARVRSSTGSWGSVQTVSAATAWHSTSFGLNVDQGPSLVISPNGTKHLVFIEHYDGTGDYGRIHYAVYTGSSWQDTALANYSHDPALALNAAGDVYIIGHGHPKSGSVGTSACLNMLNMCYLKKPSGGNWGSAQLLAQATASQSYDASPSARWSAVGFNRPEVVEALFFSILNGDYYHPTLHYARLP